MPEAARIAVRPLTADHREELAEFRCRGFREPWSELIEEMVHHLAGALVSSAGVRAAGVWSGDVLAGVAAWRVQPDGVCRSILVAAGSRRLGYGRRLKQEVLAAARRAGAVRVDSQVHVDNDAMIDLNVGLGATVHRIRGDQDHLLCRIVVR